LTRRIIALSAIAAAVLVATVWAVTELTNSSSSSSSSRQTIASNPATGTSTSPGALSGTGTATSPTVTATQPSTTPPGSSANGDALGLVLQSVPGDSVIVQAVVPGSAAASVGIGAGDKLLSVNG